MAKTGPIHHYWLLFHWVSGVIGSCNNVLDPMAQDSSEQDIVMGEQELPPQMDPRTKMAAVCDTPPPHLRQIPSPTPSEIATHNVGSVQSSPFTMVQMMEMITQAMRGETQQMEEKMEGNTKKNGG